MSSLCHMYNFRIKPQKPLFQDMLLLGQIFYIFLLTRYLSGQHMSKSTEKFRKYLEEYSSLFHAY